MQAHSCKHIQYINILTIQKYSILVCFLFPVCCACAPHSRAIACRQTRKFGISMAAKIHLCTLCVYIRCTHEYARNMALLSVANEIDRAKVYTFWCSRVSAVFGGLLD